MTSATRLPLAVLPLAVLTLAVLKLNALSFTALNFTARSRMCRTIVTRRAPSRSRTCAPTAAASATTIAACTAVLCRLFAALAERGRFVAVLLGALSTDFDLVFGIRLIRVSVDLFVVNVFFDTRGSVRAPSTTAAATVTLSALSSAALFASAATIVAATAALAQHFAEAVGVHFAHVQEFSRDRIRQEQRTAVVEVDACFPRIAGADRDHHVVVCGAPTGFDRVLGRERQVQETPPTCAQSVATRAIGIAARDTDEQLGRRLGGLAGLDLDRVSVQRADLRAFDLVALTIAAEDCVAHVHLVDRFTEAFVQRAHHVVDFGVSELVDGEVEFLRLVAEHVSERASDAFDQSGMRHGAKKTSGLCS